MDKLDKYRCLIKDYINYYVEIDKRQPSPDLESVAVFDDERGNYQLLSVGWQNGERHFYTHLYARIHNGKIWIEEDLTEYGLGNELVEKGVPKSDIVLAFHSPQMRELTDFAVA